MDFYIHARKDRIYDLICTHCFAVVASTNDPASIRVPETHQCIRPVHVSASISTETNRSQDQGGLNKPGAPGLLPFARPSAFLIAAALLLYGLPTVLEFLLIRQVNPELVVVVVGDLFGCAFIAIFFKKVWLGIALYALMSGIEASAYGLHLLPRGTLPWIADAVPTLVVLGLIQKLIQKLSQYEGLQARNSL